jgi:hypothetical protein
MDTNRIITIIMSDLSLDNLKLQESLEKSINSNDDINKKISDVKNLLSKITTNELMINKFQELTTPNNKNLNMNENG